VAQRCSLAAQVVRPLPVVPLLIWAVVLVVLAELLQVQLVLLVATQYGLLLEAVLVVVLLLLLPLLLAEQGVSLLGAQLLLLVVRLVRLPLRSVSQQLLLL
jgi:hypothetical protein